MQDRTGGAVPAAGISAGGSATGDDIGRQPKSPGSRSAPSSPRSTSTSTPARCACPHLTGVFAAGRILNAITARSQLVGGMTMGLSMALHEGAVLDPASGDVLNHDLAQYHVAANADIGSIDVAWIDEDEDTLGPAGAKGIGEVGIVGTAAADRQRRPRRHRRSASATSPSPSTSCSSTSTERRCVARLRESVLGVGIPLGRLPACGLGRRAGRSGLRRHDAAGDRGGERSAGGGADAPPGESCGRGCAPSSPLRPEPGDLVLERRR